MFGGASAEARRSETRATARWLQPSACSIPTSGLSARRFWPASDRVVAEIPEQCEGERCLRLKLAVVGEGFFDVIDKEELDALDPTDEQDAERVEALHEELRGQLRP